jgi:predicted porin
LENLEMKKTLVAIAALAATSAFAQSSVVLDGLLDVSYATIGGNVSTAKKGATIGAINGIATSTINITATDDIGGGLKATARFELDPRGYLADGAALGAHQRYVALAGGFGQIQLGTPNTSSLAAFGAASPLGTATGGGYAATNATTGMTTRLNRSAKYITPAFNGLTATLYYTPGNDADTGTAAYAGLPYQRSATELGLAYSNGPLNLSFASLRAGSSNVVAAAAPTATATSKSTTFNTLGANYTIGAATLYAGYNKGETLGTAASATGPVEFAAQASGHETKGTRVGFKYVTGAYTAILSSATQKVETTATSSVFTKREVTGLRLENALSKRTTTYVAYEAYNADKSATTANKTNILALGLRTTF